MENFLPELETIQRDGAIYQTFLDNRSFPMIATQDIGDVAAELLIETGWSGQNIRGLHGPADLTFAEAAKILSDPSAPRLFTLQAWIKIFPA